MPKPITLTQQPATAVARRGIDWSADDLLKITKMLAWSVRKYEKYTGRALYRRVNQLLPRVSYVLLGRRVSLEEVDLHIGDTQRLFITPEILDQRADKAERYQEFNEFKDVVNRLREVLTGDRW